MTLTNAQINSVLQNVVSQCYIIEPITGPLFEVMYMCGVRAGESINRNLWTFQNNDVVILTPQKWNDKRIFLTSEIPSNFLNYLQNDALLEFTHNYSRLNYLFNNLCVYPDIYIGRKKSTCHLFRHNYVKKLLEQNKTPEEIRATMGERQLKSAMAYINSKFTTYPQNEDE